jgi:hypothetical protein
LREPKPRKPKNAKRRPEGRAKAPAAAAEPAAEPPVRDSGPVEGARGNREVPPTDSGAEG